MGNHEEVFLRAVAGDLRALRFLIRIGGRETLFSYGISEEDYRELEYDELMAQVQAKVPAAHVDFLSVVREMDRGRRLSLRPCGPQARRRGRGPGDERPVLDPRGFPPPPRELRQDGRPRPQRSPRISTSAPNRIGIDTGAYASGRLTAIGLEGDERWYLST